MISGSDRDVRGRDRHRPRERRPLADPAARRSAGWQLVARGRSGGRDRPRLAADGVRRSIVAATRGAGSRRAAVRGLRSRRSRARAGRGVPRAMRRARPRTACGATGWPSHRRATAGAVTGRRRPARDPERMPRWRRARRRCARRSRLRRRRRTCSQPRRDTAAARRSSESWTRARCSGSSTWTITGASSRAHRGPKGGAPLLAEPLAAAQRRPTRHARQRTRGPVRSALGDPGRRARPPRQRAGAGSSWIPLARATAARRGRRATRCSALPARSACLRVRRARSVPPARSRRRFGTVRCPPPGRAEPALTGLCRVDRGCAVERRRTWGRPGL